MCTAVCSIARENWIELYGAKAWYRERAERVVEWRGVLKSRAKAQDPGGRVALRFELSTKQGELPVYAPETLEHWDKLVSRNIVVRGKLVDLTGEGFGRELWPGSARVTGR